MHTVLVPPYLSYEQSAGHIIIDNRYLTQPVSLLTAPGSRNIMSANASADVLFINALSYGAALAATWAAAQLVSLWTLNLPVSDVLKVHDLELYSAAAPEAKDESLPEDSPEDKIEQDAWNMKTPEYRGLKERKRNSSRRKSGNRGADSEPGSLTWNSSIRRLQSFTPREKYEQKVLAASTADREKGPPVPPPKGHKPNPKALFASNESKRIIEENGGREALIAELKASVQDLLDASADARRYCDEDTLMRCTFPLGGLFTRSKFEAFFTNKGRPAVFAVCRSRWSQR